MLLRALCKEFSQKEMRDNGKGAGWRRGSDVVRTLWVREQCYSKDTKNVSAPLRTVRQIPDVTGLQGPPLSSKVVIKWKAIPFPRKPLYVKEVG
jgi:hypothetical protein